MRIDGSILIRNGKSNKWIKEILSTRKKIKNHKEKILIVEEDEIENLLRELRKQVAKDAIEISLLVHLFKFIRKYDIPISETSRLILEKLAMHDVKIGEISQDILGDIIEL